MVPRGRRVRQAALGCRRGAMPWAVPLPFAESAFHPRPTLARLPNAGCCEAKRGALGCPRLPQLGPGACQLPATRAARFLRLFRSPYPYPHPHPHPSPGAVAGTRRGGPGRAPRGAVATCVRALCPLPRRLRTINRASRRVASRRAPLRLALSAARPRHGARRPRCVQLGRDFTSKKQARDLGLPRGVVLD